MSKNFEVVSLILESISVIPIWLDQKKITLRDIEIAIGYIKEQNILTNKELDNKVKELNDNFDIYNKIMIIGNAGLTKELRVLFNKMEKKI